jgi:hypothetical protein
LVIVGRFNRRVIVKNFSAEGVEGFHKISSILFSAFSRALVGVF